MNTLGVKNRLLLICLPACLLLAAVAGMAIWLRDRGVMTEKERLAWACERERRIGEQALEAVRAERLLAATELIVEARRFVHSNSVHSVARVHPFAKKEPYAVWRMLQTDRLHAEPIRMTCGSRSCALKWMLAKAGIKSRRVQVYSGTRDFIRGHRFIDVLNPDTGRWELQDPSYDISYRRVDTGTPVCTEEIVFGALDTVAPLSAEASGWAACGVDRLRKGYFQAMWYEELRPRTILINPDRLDIKKTFPGNGNATFEQWARGIYGNRGRRKVIIRTHAIMHVSPVTGDVAR